MIVLICGLSGAGKTTLAQNVKEKLQAYGKATEILDGDEYRKMLFKELSYSQQDRFENIRRLGFIANKFSKHGIIAIISAINPFEEIRQELVKNYDGVKIVSVNCPVEILIERDTKGLYARALLPDGHPEKLYNLTGINDRFDIPEHPDLYLDSGTQSVAECTNILFDFIVELC
jgi:adenylylsulfate kinase